MSKVHHVIIIPGLGDEIGKITWATNFWSRFGLNPTVHSVGWHTREKEFQPKLQILIDIVDTFADKGDRVSLVGYSAGGSAALNTFFERRETVHRVINICGRLRTGTQNGFRSFNVRTATSPTFSGSVKLFESNENLLTSQDKQKIMTVRPLFGDELVPADTIILRDAYNITIPTPEHVFSIAMALTAFSKPLITFLTKE